MPEFHQIIKAFVYRIDSWLHSTVAKHSIENCGLLMWKLMHIVAVPVSEYDDPAVKWYYFKSTVFMTAANLYQNPFLNSTIAI